MKKEQFEEFLAANEKRIYHYLLTLLRNDNDANGVVQMVFISFYEHIDRVEEITAVAYLYRIAYNKSMTFLKQKSRYVSLDPQSLEYLPDTNKHEPEPDHQPLHAAIMPRMKTSSIISDCIFNNYPGTVIAISHDPLWQDRWQRIWSLEAGSLKDSFKGRQ